MSDKFNKIIGYWALARLNQQQPKGDEALDKLRELTDADTTDAIMFISGFSQGMSPANMQKLKQLARVVEE